MPAGSRIETDVVEPSLTIWGVVESARSWGGTPGPLEAPEPWDPQGVEAEPLRTPLSHGGQEAAERLTARPRGYVSGSCSPATARRRPRRQQEPPPRARGGCSRAGGAGPRSPTSPPGRTTPRESPRLASATRARA